MTLKGGFFSRKIEFRPNKALFGARHGKVGQEYEEAFRILRSNGRIAISDIVLTENIAPELRDRFQSTWAGCLGGAIPEEDYWQTVREAGFAEIQIVARHLLTSEELEGMACCPGEEFTPPPSKEDRAAVEGKVSSIKFTAMKPALK